MTIITAVFTDMFDSWNMTTRYCIKCKIQNGIAIGENIGDPFIIQIQLPHPRQIPNHKRDVGSEVFYSPRRCPGVKCQRYAEEGEWRLMFEIDPYITNSSFPTVRMEV